MNDAARRLNDDSEDVDIAMAALVAEVAPSSNTPPAQFHSYRRGRELGRGAFGQVFICRRESDGKSFAVKTVSLRRMQLSVAPERELKKLHREVDILKKLPPHSNIVQLVDAFEETNWFLLVLELMGGGDLFTVLTDRRPARLLEFETVFILKQLVDGLHLLHSMGVIHRDLKLENVLVAASRREQEFVLYSVKIADFGLSKAVGQGLSEARSNVGTAGYAAPEVSHASSNAHDFRSDLWSLGVLLFVLVAGHFPFEQDAPAEQGAVDNLIGKFRGSDSARGVVRGLLQLDPAQRLSLNGIREQEWLQDIFWHNEQLQPAESVLATPKNDNIATPANTQESAQPSETLATVPDKVFEPQSKATASIKSTLQVSMKAADTSSFASGHLYEDEVRIASLKSDFMQLHLIVPRLFAEKVIKDGESDLRHMHPDCQIIVSSHRPQLEHIVIVIIASFLQSMSVQKIVRERTSESASDLKPDQACSDKVKVLLFVRSEAVGIVNGKMGFMLNEICLQSGAHIQLSQHEIRGQRPCLVTGKFPNVLLAQRIIFDLVRVVPVVPPTWYAETPHESVAVSARGDPRRGPVGRGKGDGRIPARGLLYGSVTHVTGDLVASPVQLKVEGRPIPKGHPNFADAAQLDKSRKDDLQQNTPGVPSEAIVSEDISGNSRCTTLRGAGDDDHAREVCQDDQGHAAKRLRSDVDVSCPDRLTSSPILQQRLLRWAERVNAVAAGDEALAKKCQEHVRARILRAHTEGNLHSINWDNEPLIALDNTTTD